MTPHFVWRKLHSFSGIFPVGVFLLEHLFTNSFAIQGAEAYESKIRFLQSIPYLVLVELALILLPLLYHGVYGLIITAGMGNNTARYPQLHNWMYLLQRVSGVATFIFVAVHVYTLRISNLLFGTEITFDLVSSILGNNLMFVFYTVGLAATVFHFANGIWNFLISWGITAGRGSQRTAGWCCAAIGAALFLAGFNSLLAFVGCGIRF
ncbi:MAG: succinate dehydrogenase [bacterium]